MIGLDTNVLVRYIAQDDPVQSGQASAVMASLNSDRPGFISLVVLVELVWVIQGCYRVTKQETVRILTMLLRSQELKVDQAELAWKALRVYECSSADFSDCLIAQSAVVAGCERIYTFDRAAAKGAGMELLVIR